MKKFKPSYLINLWKDLFFQGYFFHAENFYGSARLYNVFIDFQKEACNIFSYKISFAED